MKQIIGGMVRTWLSFAAGWLVSKGLATADDAGVLVNNADAIIGVVTVVGTAAWSWWSKKSGAAATK